MTIQDIKICDIHTHILPEVDDGSESSTMTLCMLYSLQRQNALGLIATPHSKAFIQHPEQTYRSYVKTAAMVEAFFPEFRFGLGCEVLCSPRTVNDVLANLRTGKFPSMNGTRFVLTEFLLSVSPESIVYCAQQLIRHNWFPIIAHIERYFHLAEDWDTLRTLKDMGCLFQLNVSNLDIHNTETCCDWPRKLIELQLIDFLSSDTHKSYYRSPDYSRGLQYLIEHCSQEYLERITWKNADEMLWNRHFPCTSLNDA